MHFKVPPALLMICPLGTLFEQLTLEACSREPLPFACNCVGLVCVGPHLWTTYFVVPLGLALIHAVSMKAWSWLAVVAIRLVVPFVRFRGKTTTTKIVRITIVPLLLLLVPLLGAHPMREHKRK